MFVDYYAILDLSFGASEQEIKNAYKKQAILWHPDKNPGKDTNSRMQLINEAYLILKDIDAREKYDTEYLRFISFKIPKEEKVNEPQYSYNDYIVHDPILWRWMQNARRQAEDMAKQAIKEFADVGKVGIKGAAKGASNYLVGYILAGVLLTIVFSIIGNCNS
jgi:curved DNA-binding protein CbpA